MKNIKTKFIQVVLISLIGLIITGCAKYEFTAEQLTVIKPYDGLYKGIAESTTTMARNNTECRDAELSLISDSGNYTGKAKTGWGYVLDIRGHLLINENNLALESSFIDPSTLRSYGGFRGIIVDKKTIKGTWHDAYGCQGTFILNKQ